MNLLSSKRYYLLNRAATCFLFATVALITLPTPVQADSTLTKRDKIEYFLEISQLNHTIQEGPAQLKKTFGDSLDVSPIWDHNDPDQVAILDLMKSELANSFSSDNLHLNVVNEIEDTVSLAQLQSQIAFYESELGKNVARTFLHSRQPDSVQAFKKFRTTFTPESADKTRLAMVTEVVDATRFHESAIDTLIDSQISMLMGFSDTAPDEITEFLYEENDGYNTVNKLNAQRDGFVAHARSYIIKKIYFDYQGLSNTEFALYRDSIKTEPAQAILDAYRNAEHSLVSESYYSVGVVSANAITQLIYEYAELEE